MNSEDDRETRPVPSGMTRSEANTGRFGMAIFLISLSILFAASIIGYLVVRMRAQLWRTTNLPPLPSGLWLSTGILVACSVVIHYALVQTRRNNLGAARKFLLAASVLGTGFLVNQFVNWLALTAAQMPPTARNLYAFTFYMLTGLHAAHVIGGLVQLGVVTRRSFRGAYTAQYHPGITYAAMYWHFLDAVWVVMFLVMIVQN